MYKHESYKETKCRAVRAVAQNFEKGKIGWNYFKRCIMYKAIVRMYNCMVVGGYRDYEFITTQNRQEFIKYLHKQYGGSVKIVSFMFVEQ